MNFSVAAPLAFFGGPFALPPLLLLVGLDACIIRHLARSDRRWRAEACALLAAQAVAVWLIAAFITSGHLGAGDSYHYGLQLADFLAQLHHGVFPVFAGQSEFGFNGNIHTLRTAPYYVHLGAVFHVLTGGRLPVFALQNLCVIFSAVGGVTSAYVAVRVLAPAWRVAAPALAALFILCPALLGSLIGMDMYATFMTLPWLPLFWLGLVGILTDAVDTRPRIIATAALVLTWYAHPAIGVWLTPFWVIALGVHAVTLDRGYSRFVRPLLTAAALGWLLTYLLVSVQTLDLTYSNNRFGSAALSIFSNLRAAWPAAWLPVVAPVGNLGNLQLGYALTALWVASLAGISRTRLPGVFFALGTGTLLVLLLPLPGVTRALWSLAPDALINATNIWPMQRFYPILAAALPIWAALTLRTFAPAPCLRGCALLALGLGVSWSAWQVQIARRHSWLVRQSPTASAILIAPVNIPLTRSSYLMFDFYPAYYSHGVMEPSFETRLLDAAMQPLLDNASALFATKSVTLPFATLKPLLIPTRQADVRRREATFRTDRHSHYLLAFTFTSPPPVGDIELFGGGLNRHYVLPEFGSPLAFGAGPKSSPYLPICLPPGPPATITLRTEIPQLTARVYAFRPEELPIRTATLMPLKIQIDAPQPAFLETPRVFIPGYIASINGVATPVVRSPEGLVAVPVPTGPAEVIISYVGPGPLRAAFWFSAAGFLVLPLCGVWAWRRAPAA
ncbi:MAG: hypothetical protein H7343_01535 [Undibacterium sp.]|nr:hypothetical protein [Opitutaceae bacterium]